jgi:hypothetical protein
MVALTLTVAFITDHKIAFIQVMIIAGIYKTEDKP